MTKTKTLRNRLGTISFEVGNRKGSTHKISLSPIEIDRILVILKEEGLKFLPPEERNFTQYKVEEIE